MRKVLKSLFVLLCSLIAFLSPIYAQEGHPALSVHDALSLQLLPSFASPIKISPDGLFVAYTLKSQATQAAVTEERYLHFSKKGTPRLANGAAVWITDVKTGKSEKILEKANSWGASWSQDGRYLAFYSDKGSEAGIWIWERAINKSQRLPGVIARPFFFYEVPEWTPDSKRVLSKILPEGLSIEDAADLLVASQKKAITANETLRSTVRVYRFSPNDGDEEKRKASIQAEIDLDRYLCDLALINIDNGNVQRIARRFKPTGYFISPDGSHIAFANVKGLETLNSFQTLHDIIIVSVTEGSSRVISQNVKMTFGTSISWSPDSKSLAYLTSGPIARGDCYVVEVGKGEPRNLTEAAHPNFGGDFRRPLWDYAGNKIYCLGDNNIWAVAVPYGGAEQITRDMDREVVEIVAPNGKGTLWSPGKGENVYLATRNRKTKQVGFYRVNLKTGAHSALFEENKAYGSPLVFGIDVSENKKSVIYVAQDAQHPPDIWLAGVDFESPRRITCSNAQLEKYVMGESRLVEWESEDGQKLQGALLLPTDYLKGRRYPMIVDVYGGRRGSDYVYRFGLAETGVSNEQLLATRGYVVFVPDMPLEPGTPLTDIAKTVLPGVDKVIEMGIADSERLGVTGRSYGGYCALALIVQTSRFKAAVSRSGFANLFTAYGVMVSGIGGLTAWAEEGQGNMLGPPWMLRERYLKNSPLFYFDKITTPVLLVHGEADQIFPSFLSDEAFVVLQRLGKKVEYAKYKGGEHTELTFGYADSVDYFNRMIAWFHECLQERSVKAKPPGNN